MIPHTLSSVLKFLQEEKYPVHVQSETQQIYMVYHLDGREFPLFVKLDEAHKTLQILIFFSCKMRPKAPPEVARLLHMLNKEIDLPGLGMDENAGVIFYRHVLFCPNDQVDETLLNHILLSMLRAAPIFFPIISTVAGGTYFEAIAAEARAILQKSSKK